MFYTLILENETGQQIDLSKTANRFMFSKIEITNYISKIKFYKYRI